VPEEAVERERREGVAGWTENRGRCASLIFASLIGPPMFIILITPLIYPKFLILCNFV